MTCLSVCSVIYKVITVFLYAFTNQSSICHRNPCTLHSCRMIAPYPCGIIRRTIKIIICHIYKHNSAVSGDCFYSVIYRRILRLIQAKSASDDGCKDDSSVREGCLNLFDSFRILSAKSIRMRIGRYIFQCAKLFRCACLSPYQ